MGLGNICTRKFKHHYGGSFISLCNYESMIEMGPPMSEKQVRESQFRVVSHHPPRWGMGCYINTLEVVGFSDYDYASCVNDKNSTSCYIFMMTE